MKDKPATQEVREYLAALGKKGGQRTSYRKRKANREKILQYWREVKAGIRKKPHVGRPAKKIAPEASSQE